jgi:hypothetical protein
MKLGIIILILLVSYFSSFGQKSQFSILKESKIKIINFDLNKDPNKLPLLTFTILNRTKENIIFNRIVLVLKEFKKHPTSSSSNSDLKSKELTPIAGLDLSIPIQENTYTYTLRYPIEITAKEAATVQIRIHCDLANKCIVPSQIGFFKFNLLFMTYDFKTISSNEIILGD